MHDDPDPMHPPVRTVERCMVMLGFLRGLASAYRREGMRRHGSDPSDLSTSSSTAWCIIRYEMARDASVSDALRSSTYSI